jgi:hypothetical protein
MAAAEITPTVVSTYKPVYSTTVGTALKLVEHLVKVSKVTQNDWIIVATTIPTGETFLGVLDAYTIAANGNGAAETYAYTQATDKLVLSSAAVTTVYLRLLCQVS